MARFSEERHRGLTMIEVLIFMVLLAMNSTFDCTLQCIQIIEYTGRRESEPPSRREEHCMNHPVKEVSDRDLPTPQQLVQRIRALAAET